MTRSSTGNVTRTLFFSLAWLVSGLSQANAGFTVSLASTTPDGTNTIFNYTASVGTTDTIAAGDGFTIYNFGGYVPGSVTAPAGWVATDVNDETLPSHVILTHGNDPALPNLTFTYEGSTPIVGPTTLTGFSAISTLYASMITKDFTGVTTSGVGQTESVGDVQVPGSFLPYPSPAPEPSSLLSAGLGLIVLGFVYRHRRGAASAA